MHDSSPKTPGNFKPDELMQAWPLPTNPRPVVILGAGSIVRDAHLTAYKQANIPIFTMLQMP